SRKRKRLLVCCGVPKPANCLMVHRRLRYMLACTPRVNGNCPGNPRSVSGSKAPKWSAVYSASTGTPLTVVGGMLRRGAAWFSLSQRSKALRFETVAIFSSFACTPEERFRALSRSRLWCLGGALELGDNPFPARLIVAERHCHDQFLSDVACYMPHS